MTTPLVKYKPPLLLALLTAAALAVQGYHPFSEDAEIYLPGVEHILNPKLFPVGQEFFLSHSHLTLFPNVLALFLRLTHLPLTAGLFLWQIASIYLLLLACWQLSGLLFPSPTFSPAARWGGVCLVAALLSIPIAGTALYLMDQYINPRNLAAFAGMFALVCLLEKKYLRALLWLVFAAAMHPLMWVFPTSFCALFITLDKLEALRGEWKTPASAAALIILPLSPQATQAYHQAALKHPYHYIQNWAWYEILGAIAPIFLFWFFAHTARQRRWTQLARVSRAFALYALIYLVMALAFDLPARFEALARIQPLRSLHFLYIVMFVIIGGLLGEFILQARLWRWLLLFLPLSAGMFLAQRSLFPASAHIEFPGQAPKNPWAQAFLWVQRNTPPDALFALDPNTMTLPGEDEIGFRCLAQRSRLADSVKDNGVVSMFPPLADRWWQQVQDQAPWPKFQTEDFLRLEQKYGVGWIVVAQPITTFRCPYSNGTVTVCRLP